MDVPSLLDDWLTQIKVEIGAHYEAARRYEAYNSRLGYPTVILSAITGTAITGITGQSAEAAGAVTGAWAWTHLAAIGLSVSVTILSSLATFTQFSARAAAHKTAALELSKLRREIEVSLVLGDPITRAVLDSFRTKRDELGKSTPTIPDAIFQRHRARSDRQQAVKPEPKR